MAKLGKRSGLVLALLRFVVILVGPWLVGELVWRTWPVSPTSFYVGWLVVAVFLGCRETIRSSAGSRQLWPAAILPFGASFAVSLGMIVLARRIVRQPSGELLLAFILVAVTFLILMLVWIVAFPFERGSVSFTKAQRRTFKAATIVGAIGVSSHIVFRATEEFRAFHGAASAFQLLLLQIWIIRETFLIYYFFVFRAFGPRTVSELITAFRHLKEKPAAHSTGGT
jgi:hypothetical protein